MVFLFLFPLIAIVLGYLHYENQFYSTFLIAVMTNLVFVSVLWFFLWSYAKLKIKASLWSVFGIGDLLIIAALAFGFPTITFTILLVSSLVFSVILHFLFKKKQEDKSVPLAGYMSFFILVVLLLSWNVNQLNLYLF